MFGEVKVELVRLRKTTTQRDARGTFQNNPRWVIGPERMVLFTPNCQGQS